MKKILYLILIPTLVFASNSPFSRVRVTKYDADGTPSEEVNDVVICLERSPTSAEKKNYEDVLGYYADGLYEATNGANFIGNVIIYTNGRYCSSADITWNKGERWPGALRAGASEFPTSGVIQEQLLMFQRWTLIKIVLILA